jgi:hypothetical protein
VESFFGRGIKEARKHTDDLSRTSPMKIKRTECKLLQEERKRDGRGKKRRREGEKEGREKVGEKKKRRKSGDLFRAAPLAGDFLIFCAFFGTPTSPLNTFSVLLHANTGMTPSGQSYIQYDYQSISRPLQLILSRLLAPPPYSE